jgi:hypothetical protein
MYSETDLINIDQAILAMATGKRVTKVVVGDHSTEFAVSSLADLKALRAEVVGELAVQQGTFMGYKRVATSKGL